MGCLPSEQHLIYSTAPAWPPGPELLGREGLAQALRSATTASVPRAAEATAHVAAGSAPPWGHHPGAEAGVPMGTDA